MWQWLKRLVAGPDNHSHDVAADYVRDEQQELRETLAALGIEVDVTARKDTHDRQPA